MDKKFRKMEIRDRLEEGRSVSKKELMDEYCTSEKSIQRDIADLKEYYAERQIKDAGYNNTIVYDRKRNVYYLNKIKRQWLNSNEVLAICKILLESRAFEKEELRQVMDKLLDQVSPMDSNVVKNMLNNEYKNFIPLQHGKKLFDPMWELSNYINSKEIVKISYTAKEGATREHEVKPVAIMFSEFYFYLIAYMADDRKPDPTTFRVDRISSFSGTGKTFDVPYKDRFEDIEFRKRVVFMYGGEEKHVKFKFKGVNPEPVLDKLPTARYTQNDDGSYTVSVDCFGDGIEMWLRSQGDWIERIK